MAYQLVLTAVVALAAVGHAGVVAPGLLGAPGLVAGPGLIGNGYLGAPGLVNPGLAYGHGPIAVAAPAIAKVAVADDYDPNPQYSYSYNIQDALTGDNKGQSETRSGDVVQGQYNLVEPDGTRRVVDYTADPVNGFNAVVRREPLAVAAKAVVPAAIGVPAYGGYGHVGVGVPAYGGFGHVGVGVPAYGGYGVAKAIAPVGLARPYGAYPGILG